MALGLIVALLLAPCGAAFAATPAEDAVLVAFSDDMESGPGNWVVDTAIPLGAPWAIIVGPNHSPTHSWFTDDPANISDKRVRLANNVTVPAGSNLSFWLQWNTETGFDGTVLEYSLDGTTWTDILAAQGSIPADANRITQTPYNATISGSFQSPIANRRAWAGNGGPFQEVRVNLTAFAGVAVRFRWRFASDNSVSATGVWLDDVQIAASLEPVSLVVDGAGDGILEPAENVVVEPTWRNTTAAAIAVTGALSNFTGPAGPTYVISDGTAAYGSIAAGGTAACTSDCYSVAITNAATRPAQHWDATARETLTPGGVTKDWTLHVGDSFADVPRTSPFYRFIETILHKDVTGGCSATNYCPASATTREQMAVFVLVAKEPVGYTPPACGATPMFADVPVTSPFCRWIQELANRGVVAGCGGGNYCPGSSVTRDAMAVFVLLTLDPAMNPPACGATPMFADVPASSPFCKWVEELARRGVVTGCGGGNYCPTNPVTREQMGVFLSVTFSLVLYGG
jgi:hypothetical protein